MIRFPRLLMLPAVCLALAASGCITAITTLTVRPDGSGTLEQSMSMSAAMADQFAQMTRGLSDATATGPKTSGPPELFSEKEMKDAASKYGEGVLFMSSRPIKTADRVGRVAVYQFADITKVRLNQKPSAGEKAAAVSGSGKPEDVLFRFARQPAGTSLLTVVFPEPQINPAKKAGDTPAALKPDPTKLAMAKKLFEDLKVEISVDVLGSIVKTNSPYVQGSKVTLLEMDFSQLLDNDQLLGQVTQPGSIEEAKKLLQGVKGFKVNLNREVTIEFR